MRQLGDVQAREGHAQRLALEPFACTQWARAWAHELGHALAHLRALRMHEGVQYVAPGATEGALVAGLLLAFEGGAGLRRGQAGIHRGRGGFFGEQNPVALRVWQVAPGNVHVIAQGDQDVAQVLALPGHGPGRHRALANGQRRVGDQGCLSDFIDAAQAVAFGAGTLWGVGREVFGVQHRLPSRVMAGARVEHAY
ncbi:hypothetical protein D3C81_983570 [compost metagenome]